MLRGALAGAAAAGVWGAQQPLDKRVFGVDYDDAELLGSAVTRERGTLGDLRPRPRAARRSTARSFGAVYAAASPGRRRPGRAARRAGRPGRARRHLAADPLPGPRAPGRREFPQLWGDRRALAQATWRHLLFGTLLGVIEERLNPPPGEAAPAEEDHSTSNGHGNVEHLLVTRA